MGTVQVVTTACTNKLTVTGGHDAVLAFAAHCGGVTSGVVAMLADGDPGQAAVVAGAFLDGSLGTFQLEHVVPNVAPEGGVFVASGPRPSWQRRRWGSPGDVISTIVTTTSPGCMAWVFETPVSPPVPWSLAASALHPQVKLHMESFEPITDLVAFWDVVAGTVTDAGDHHAWAAAAKAAWEFANEG